MLIPNLLKEKSFNERLDGIIYSVFLSLGFATIENIIYILFEDQTSAFEVGVISIYNISSCTYDVCCNYGILHFKI